jgi:nicotinamidase-related amidase
MMADLCLGSTLFSATARDYRVTALTDCITTLWPNILEAMYDIFGRKLARLHTSEQTIAELEGLLKVIRKGNSLVADQSTRGRRADGK